MKFAYVHLMALLIGHSSLTFAQVEVDCDPALAIPVAAGELLDTLKNVSEGLYKDIATLKVNHDGEGKLSVFFEKGVPKILKLTYKNGNGTVVKQITFDELAKGNPLIYENTDKPGKAIMLEKGLSFKEGNYDFKLKVRSKLSPEEFQTYPLNFDPNINSPRVTHNKKTFKKMIISPGVSMFSWDGTFNNVEFQN